MIQTDYGLEINAVRHCTNACVACNHASTRYTEPYTMDVEILRRDVSRIKDLLIVKLFMIQGGEPLLHPEICEMLRIIYDANMSGQTGVLTNGKLLPIMKDEFWEVLGERRMELRMSCYPDLSPDIVPLAISKAEKYGFSVRPQQINSFAPLFQKNDGSNYHGCPWNRCLTIHEGWFYLCPLTAFFPRQFMNLPEHIDGIPLEGLTEDGLRSFLHHQTPLETCKICAGAKGPKIAWHQNKSKQEWMEEAGAPAA